MSQNLAIVQFMVVARMVVTSLAWKPCLGQQEKTDGLKEMACYMAHSL